jgi:hypothetical protein
MEPNAMLRLKGHAIIASSNFARDVINADKNQAVVVDLQSTRDLFTVLGNILTGIIHVNAAPMAAPWANLNVQSSAL